MLKKNKNEFITSLKLNQRVYSSILYPVNSWYFSMNSVFMTPPNKNNPIPPYNKSTIKYIFIMSTITGKISKHVRNKIL